MCETAASGKGPFFRLPRSLAFFPLQLAALGTRDFRFRPDIAMYRGQQAGESFASVYGVKEARSASRAGVTGIGSFRPVPPGEFPSRERRPGQRMSQARNTRMWEPHEGMRTGRYCQALRQSRLASLRQFFLSRATRDRPECGGILAIVAEQQPMRIPCCIGPRSGGFAYGHGAAVEGVRHKPVRQEITVLFA